MQIFQIFIADLPARIVAVRKDHDSFYIVLVTLDDLCVRVIKQ